MFFGRDQELIQSLLQIVLAPSLEIPIKCACLGPFTKGFEKPYEDALRNLGRFKRRNCITDQDCYRKLVKLYHPDKAHLVHPDAENRIREINAAYSVLSKPLSPASYDAKLNKDVFQMSIAPTVGSQQHTGAPAEQRDSVLYARARMQTPELSRSASRS